MCSPTVHCYPHVNRFHVPTNPVLNNFAPPAPDVLAPAVFSSNICRPGCTGQYNFSFPVYRQTGNTSGLSTFRLSSQLQTYTPSTEIAAAKGLVLQHRPDILHATQQTKHVASTIPQLLDYYTSSPHHPSDNDIASHKQTGSYIDMEDAFFLSDVYNTSSTTNTTPQEPNDDNHQHCKLKPKDCVLTVHPAGGTGSKLFHIPNAQFIGRRNNTLGPIIYSTLMTFLNSSHLYEVMLQDMRTSENHSNLQKTLVSAVQNLRTCHGTGPLNAQLTRSLTDLLATVEGNFPEEHIARFIQLACTQVGSFTFQTLLELQQILTYAENNIILLTTDAPDFETLNLPTDFGQDHWNLMLSLTARDTFQMNARWSINTAWQTFAGQPVVIRLPTHQHFLMYVRSAYRIQPAQRLMLERCCGQTQAYCVLHKQLLIRQAQCVHIPCSVLTCTCFLFWCCPHKFGDRNQCSFGLCRKHFKLTIPDMLHMKHSQ